MKIICRGNANDYHEVISILSGRDYPIGKYINDLGDTPVIVDVGAHIGTFTLFIKNLFPKAKLFCLEPFPSNFKLLIKNIRANRLKFVKPLNVALSGNYQVSKTTKLFVDENSPNSNSIFIKSKNSKYILTKIISLKLLMDSFNYNKIDLLKLDCEGCEYDVIEDIVSYKLNIRYLIMEYHLFGKHKKQSFLINKLTSHNYELIYLSKFNPLLKTGTAILRKKNFNN